MHCCESFQHTYTHAWMYHGGDAQVIVPTGDVKAAVKKYCESVYQTKRRPTR